MRKQPATGQRSRGNTPQFFRGFTHAPRRYRHHEIEIRKEGKSRFPRLGESATHLRESKIFSCSWRLGTSWLSLSQRMGHPFLAHSCGFLLICYASSRQVAMQSQSKSASRGWRLQSGYARGREKQYRQSVPERDRPNGSQSTSIFRRAIFMASPFRVTPRSFAARVLLPRAARSASRIAFRSSAST